MNHRTEFDNLAFDILLGLREATRYRSTVNALAGKDRVAKGGGVQGRSRHCRAAPPLRDVAD